MAKNLVFAQRQLEHSPPRLQSETLTFFTEPVKPNSPLCTKKGQSLFSSFSAAYRSNPCRLDSLCFFLAFEILQQPAQPFHGGLSVRAFDAENHDRPVVEIGTQNVQNAGT